MHLCLVKLKDNKQALSVLQSIPSKQRKTKINMAIARLNHQMDNFTQAISAYNKVLKVSICLFKFCILTITYYITFKLILLK